MERGSNLPVNTRQSGSVFKIKQQLAEGEWTDTGAVVDQGGQRYALYTGTSDSTAQLLVDQQLLQAHQSN